MENKQENVCGNQQINQVSSFKVYWLSALYVPLTIYKINRSHDKQVYKKCIIYEIKHTQMQWNTNYYKQIR